VVLTPLFVNRFLDLNVHYVDAAVPMVAALAVVPIVFYLARFDIVALCTYYGYVWVPLVLSCASLVVGLAGYACWRRCDFESVAMFLLGAMGFVFGVRDHLFDFYPWVPGTTFYTQYVAIVQLVCCTP